jgi:succinoglycan biosynthesis protein ExoM
MFYEEMAAKLRGETLRRTIDPTTSNSAAALSELACMRIDVCIATFKRPVLLERLLRDLRAQQLPVGVSTHIIVVDNDAEESARPVAIAFQAAGTSLEYLTQPEQNIALTRNCALDHSQGDLIAFIDDDESAPTGWLASLLTAMERYAADVVLGPVMGILPADAPPWIVKGRFFERPERPTGTRVQVGGTGNALLRASAVRGKIAFDPRYGLTGSEDTDFFHRLRRRGALMVWCQEALLTEDVAPGRLTMAWLFKRGFAAGQRYADIVNRPSGGVRLPLWIGNRASLAVGASLLAMSCMPFSKALAGRYAIKVANYLGQLSTILRYRHQPYRNPVT